MSERNSIYRPGFNRGDYVYIGYGTYKGFIGRYYSSSPTPYSEGYTNQSLIEVIMWDRSPVKFMPRSKCEMVLIHDSCYVKIDMDQLQTYYGRVISGKVAKSRNTVRVNSTRGKRVYVVKLSKLDK